MFLAGTVPEGGTVALAVIVAALAGAAIAEALRIPRPAGYLLAGAVIGPGGAGFVADPDDLGLVAEAGVALLLFTVALELSVSDLVAHLRAALLIGVGQLLIVGAAVMAGGVLAGEAETTAAIMAGAAGLSSTATGLALLPGLGDAGRRLLPLATGILIVQDVFAVVIIGLAPSLHEGTLSTAGSVTLGIASSLAAMLAVLPILILVSDALLRRLAARVDREVFVVALLALVAGSAAGAAAAGLSTALGAFIAGFVIRQSGYAYQAVRETETLRDLFAAAFFVSAGLLFDLDIVSDEPAMTGVLLASVVLVKFAAITGLARLTGMSWPLSLGLGGILANAGEFSFVAVSAADASIAPKAVIAAVVFTMVISLFASSVFVAVRGRGERGARLTAPAGGVAVVGYGRLGRMVALKLRDRGSAVFVVEADGEAVRRARQDGFPATWGDVGHRNVARQITGAEVVLVTPAGQEGAGIVERLSRLVRPGTKVVAAAMPERVAHLGLDLTVVEADERLSAEVVTRVEQACKARAEPFALRTGGGLVRFPPAATRRVAKRSDRLWQWLERRPEAGGDSCSACGGTGRSRTWLFSTPCPACGGTGRSPR